MNVTNAEKSAERLQAEKLQYENLCLKKIMDTLLSGICFVDTDRKIRFNNKTQRKIFRLAEDATGADPTIGRDVVSVYPNTGHVHAQATKRQCHKDFLTFDEYGVTVRTNYFPIWDGDRLLGSVGISKRLEDYKDIIVGVKDIAFVENSFSSMFDGLRTAIIAVDTTGNVLYANEACEQLIGSVKAPGGKLSVDGLAKTAISTMANAKRMHETTLNLGGHAHTVISLPIMTDDTVKGCLCILHGEPAALPAPGPATRAGRPSKVKNLRQVQLPDAFRVLVGNSPGLTDQLAIAAKAAPLDCSVMIRGSNGVGKEEVARAIHAAGNRAAKPFIAVNCAAIPDTLLESELFGYAPGAFTGASRSGKPGKFEMANGGTIFLDEIGNMSYYMQAKLLRILQDKENERVGDTKPNKLDVRVLSATNKNLEEMIATGEFREDLYYRLNVVILKLPDLKDRREDIPLLAYHFLNFHAGSGAREDRIVIEDEALDILLRYDWPGNARELSNVIEAAMVFAEEGVIRPFHLPAHLWARSAPAPAGEPSPKMNSVGELLAETERLAIIQALRDAENNKTRAMGLLKMSRRTFYQKLKKYRINT